jgi:hypothetical protein
MRSVWLVNKRCLQLHFLGQCCANERCSRKGDYISILGFAEWDVNGTDALVCNSAARKIGLGRNEPTNLDEGDGTGIGDGLWDCEAEWRIYMGGKRVGKSDDIRNLSADSVWTCIQGRGGSQASRWRCGAETIRSS